MAYMARLDQRNPSNAPGTWFVDTRCIDCGTCRELAPTLFEARGELSIVAAQPEGEEAWRDAWRAAFACPTQSIGAIGHPARRKNDPYPEPLGHGVYALGHNSELSYGADSFLVVRPSGNLLIDSPRAAGGMLDSIEGLGGVADVLLTHQDDVADAEQFATRFGARVWIHEHDRAAAPFASDLVLGSDPVDVATDVRAIPVPGHTRGSVVYVVDELICFSGDSLAWSHERTDLTAFRGACWYDWSTQLRSLAHLADAAQFSMLLPGHGTRVTLPHEEMHDRLLALVARG